MADTVLGISVRDQRVKWLVVGGLAAVLLALVVFRDGGSAGAGAAVPGVRARVGSVPAASERVKAERARWNAASISDEEFESTLQFDPFAPRLALQQQLRADDASNNGSSPPPDPEEVAEESRKLAIQQRIQEFQKQKVSVVFQPAGGAASAIVGGRMLREGQVFDGIKVVSISAAGVVLEAATDVQSSDAPAAGQ